MFDALTQQPLDEKHHIFTGRIPDHLVPDDDGFDELWRLHPDEFHEIKIHGRLVKTPRWQQAFGADYHFTGQTFRAEATPALVQVYLDWAQATLCSGLNGILVNWYDGGQNHYIGKHRDSVSNMVDGAPIVTVSLGEERKFRMRPWKGKGYLDFAATPGSVIVIPYETNRGWTHEVPASKAFQKRRISVTMRAFKT